MRKGSNIKDIYSADSDMLLGWNISQVSFQTCVDNVQLLKAALVLRT